MLRTQWDPFQDLRGAQEERAQTQNGKAVRPRTPAWAPALDIAERKDAYLVTVELPGVKLDDLEITLEDGRLTIQGERQFTSEFSEEQYHRVERSSGAFRRSITLPALSRPTRSRLRWRTACCASWSPRPKRPSPSASR